MALSDSCRQRSRSPKRSPSEAKGCGLQEVRRWPGDSQKEYYTFEQWVSFVRQQGLAKQHGVVESEESIKHVALRFWHQGVTKETDQRQLKSLESQKFASHVSQLDTIPFDALKNLKTDVPIVLAHAYTGNSLRFCKGDAIDLIVVDLDGGAGSLAELIMVIDATKPTLQARFRSKLFGTYLQYDGGEFKAGSQNPESGTIFEVRKWEASLPMVSLSCKESFQVVGFFVTRYACEASLCDKPSTAPYMEMFTDDKFGGIQEKQDTRRCFALDQSDTLYSFEEFEKYVCEEHEAWDEETRDCAKDMWDLSYVDWGTMEMKIIEAVQEIPRLQQGKRWWKFDTSKAAYTFPEFVKYVYNKGWGGVLPESTMKVAIMMWDASVQPWHDVESATDLA